MPNVISRETSGLGNSKWIEHLVAMFVADAQDITKPSVTSSAVSGPSRSITAFVTTVWRG
jgi:hypothetical protein